MKLGFTWLDGWGRPRTQSRTIAAGTLHASIAPSRLSSSRMDVAALTRRLVDIESITGNEGPVGDFLCAELLRRGFQAEKMPVEGARHNVFATSPGHLRPAIVFSTHMDTVPPFVPCSEN